MPFGENWDPVKRSFVSSFQQSSGLSCGSGSVQASESATVAGWQNSLAAELFSSRQQNRG
jgi:hypothetical protein